MRIAILTPHYGDVKARFSECLANMVSRTMSTKIVVNDKPAAPSIKAFFEGGTNLIDNRERLIERAREWKADYLLWADSDHTFPTDSLTRLLGHNLPVVGCNYAQRGRPTAPVAARFVGDGAYSRIWTTEEEAKAGKVEEVAFVGLGFCLMQAQVLNGLEGSLFQSPLGADGRALMGEDVFFFKRLREAGNDIYLDHGLSWAIGHIWEDARYLSDAIAEKDEWWARQRKAEGPVYVRSLLSAAGSQ